MVFLECGGILELRRDSRVTSGNSGCLLCWPREVQSSIRVAPGSSFYEIFQARILETFAISFSRNLPDPGIKPGYPALQADSLLTELPGKPKKVLRRGQLTMLRNLKEK